MSLFSQIVCRSVCIFYHCLRKCKNLFENFLETFGGHHPSFPNAYNCFRIYHSPTGSCFELSSAHFSVSLLFECFFISWEQLHCLNKKNSIASHQCFHRCSWYYSEGYLIKETFLQYLLHCWEPFWGILGLILVISFYYWELLSILSYEILCRCFFCYSDSQCAKINLRASFPLLGALSSIFGPVSGTLLNVLRNLKHSLDILHELFDIVVVVTKLKNILYFVILSSSNSSGPSNIFVWVSVYLSFPKYKEIPVVATEVENTNMSTLLYVYPYFLLVDLCLS